MRVVSIPRLENYFLVFVNSYTLCIFLIKCRIEAVTIIEVDVKILVENLGLNNLFSAGSTMAYDAEHISSDAV